MSIVSSIDRPDTNGIPPKMQPIAELLQSELRNLSTFLPYSVIECNDNIMSSVFLSGSFQSKEKWNYGIFENSPHFRFHLIPAKGKRYYTEGEPITVEIILRHHTLAPFRKYTGPAHKAIHKMLTWIATEQEKFLTV